MTFTLWTILSLFVPSYTKSVKSKSFVSDIFFITKYFDPVFKSLFLLVLNVMFYLNNKTWLSR